MVRSSKGNGQEDYYVDAVEVVSFGHSFFFRSLEKPKSFLVPASDYEILELRETRMVLKNVSAERAIKIGGGRDAPPRPREPAPREVSPEEDRETQEASSSEEPSVASADSKGGDRKRDRRRRGRRGGQNRVATPVPHAGADNTPGAPIEGVEQMEGSSSVEEPKAPSFISKLFPPPPTLIKETLGRYKMNEPVEEESFNQSSDDSPKHSVEEGSIDLSDPNEEGPSREEKEFEE